MHTLHKLSLTFSFRTTEILIAESLAVVLAHSVLRLKSEGLNALRMFGRQGRFLNT